MKDEIVFTINGMTVRIIKTEEGYKATTQNSHEICTVDYFTTVKEVEDYIATCKMLFSSFNRSPNSIES